jgi:hypothetical protein
MPQNLTPTRIVTAIAVLLVVAGSALLLTRHSGRSDARPAQSVHARSVGTAVSRPRSYVLTNAKIARWAVVLKPARAFSRPSAAARVVTTLPAMTSDGTQNIVLVLGAVAVGEHQLWYRVRLAILPNNSIGWVPRSALGTLYSVNTHLYVDLATMTAVLKRKGIPVFTTLIGVGRQRSPTPRGQFYIRDKLEDFHDAFYGPVAFGTSARSAVLTGWINGGFIGVHGTDEPEILPGRVSHGCVRMPNKSILTLARLMPVGTPVTIT